MRTSDAEAKEAAPPPSAPPASAEAAPPASAPAPASVARAAPAAPAAPAAAAAGGVAPPPAPAPPAAAAIVAAVSVIGWRGEPGIWAGVSKAGGRGSEKERLALVSLDRALCRPLERRTLKGQASMAVGCPAPRSPGANGPVGRARRRVEGAVVGGGSCGSPPVSLSLPAPISRPRLADAVRRLLATMDCSRPDVPPPLAGDRESAQAVSRHPHKNTPA